MVNRHNRILYFAPRAERSDAFFHELRGASGVSVGDGPTPPCVTVGDIELCWSIVHDADAALAALQTEYVHLLLLDLRCTDTRSFEICRNEGLALLTRLDDIEDVEERYGFHRIIVLVSGPDCGRVDQLLVELGARGIRTVLRQRETTDDAAAELAGRAVTTAIELIRQRRRGKRALCTAGGGITGIYFELGALKCLDDCLPRGALSQFDMYFGISAGAVVTSMLANGYSVDEIMAAIAGVPGGRIAPIDFRLLRMAHVNAKQIARHLRVGVGETSRQLWAAVRRLERPSLTGLFLAVADAVPPPFHSDAFERTLRDILTQPGATNDFRKLPHGLYIGATDQDARRHVLFGDELHRDIPISRAVQASSAINPAFTSVDVGGRFYEDGAVTRTANFAEAIRRDATLVFVFDPFLPYVSREPGHARSNGLLYNIDQNIRTVSYTRFENSRNWILRRHPEVSSYTFLPSNTLRRVLSRNPMDHRPYMEIWRGAYLSTLKRIKHLRHRMKGDLAAHGFALDPSRAESVAVRLRAAEQPRLRDFFPNGRVELSMPPLVADPRPADLPVRQLLSAG